MQLLDIWLAGGAQQTRMCCITAEQVILLSPLQRYQRLATLTYAGHPRARDPSCAPCRRRLCLGLSPCQLAAAHARAPLAHLLVHKELLRVLTFLCVRSHTQACSCNTAS